MNYLSTIRFKKPHFEIGYSHNGKTATFNRIVHHQANLLNEPFIHYTNQETYPYDSLPAIWVTAEKFDAFKRHLRPEERVHSYGHLILRYPTWKSKVESIDMSNYILIDGIYQKGFYLAIDKRAANRSALSQQINHKFIESITKHDKDYVEITNKLLGANLAGQFSDRQTIDRMFLARERYWDRTQALIDRYNELRNKH